MGSNTQAWCGFKLFVNLFGTSSSRTLFDISFNNGTTWHCLNLYGFLNLGGYQTIDVPLAVPANSTIVMRAQTTGATSTGIEAFLDGYVANSQDPPGFTTMTTLTGAASNTRADLPDIPAVASGSGSWTVVHNLSTTYNALMILPTDSTAAPVADALVMHVGVATQGAAADTEVLIAKFPMFVGASGVLIITRDNLIVEYPFAANQRISLRLEGGVGGYNLRTMLYGLK
jgi:hypothetical protein